MTIQELAEFTRNVFLTLAFVSFFSLLAVERKRPKVAFAKTTSEESVHTNLTAFYFNNVGLTLVRATSLFFVAQEFAGHGFLHGMEEGPTEWPLTFLIFDFSIYLWHFIMHNNEFL